MVFCRWRFRRGKMKKILVAVFIMVLLVVLILYITSKMRPKMDEYLPEGFVIDTSGCQIPDTNDLYHEEYFHKEKESTCNNGIPALFDSNLTSIYLKNSSLDNYTDQDANVLKCCYLPFHREEPKHDDDKDSNIKFEKKCIPFNISAKITYEFIKVVCSVNNTNVYTDFFSFVPIKTEKQIFEKQPLSVLIIGIDAISRVNFHKQMPKTVAFLKNNISAVELLGYSKVGDNTFPNLMPVLAGFSEKQLHEVCWNENNNNRFDSCPFIWKEYKKKGFVTAFGEDSSWMGIFNYDKKGFKKQPTDYSWGYFNRISEDEIGNSHNMNVDECVGSRQVYKVFLNYIGNFVETMDSEQLPYFGFFWGASLSHDYLNKPSIGDEDFYQLLKDFDQNGRLNNTALILMSDHGMRFGPFRTTYRGQMEDKLPFVFMVLPDWYKKQYPEAYNNLLKNQKRLTTPYDLHETLKDLLNPTRESLQNRYPNISRGYSLFHEIPENRTCKDADIGYNWCICLKTVKIDIADNNVKEGANFAVKKINEKLEEFPQCANLSLNNIINARRVLIENLEDDKVKGYRITFQTTPGDGVFEATLTRTIDKFEIIDQISRINRYGKQGACIPNSNLELYCYC